MNFKIGDKVRISVKPVHHFDFENVYKFDGCEGRLTRIVSVQGHSGGYCEIEGLVAPLGVPYTFLTEWLEKVE